MMAESLNNLKKIKEMGLKSSKKKEGQNNDNEEPPKPVSTLMKRHRER